eukprot:gene57749-biopygen112317
MSGGRTSAWRQLQSGVPQGSVWGPLAFALYSADIGEYIKEAQLVTYADDITIVCSHKDAQVARAMMNRALGQLGEWARSNRIAPEPSKTQLMVSGPHRFMKDLRELACEMGGQQISPADVIKVLGVLIDEQMTWDAHCAGAAKRAHRAVWAVARAAQHFKVKERASLMKSLALPHLDFCQSALAQPSADAQGRVRRMYHKAARTAVWGLRALHRWGPNGTHLDSDPSTRLRSEPARRQLRWITWEQRRAAVRAAVTAKIFHTGEPEVLRKLLPAVTAAVLHDRRLRSHTKGCVVTFTSRTAMGEKAFSVWGPKVLNAIARDAVYDKCPQGAPEECPEARGSSRVRRKPADEHAVERAGFYARLRHRFAGQAEWHDGGGRVRVWTDGSRCLRGMKASAGAGVFYVLHVLRTEQHPVMVRSDCRYVVDGVNTGRKAWRARAWFERPLEGRLIPNADLWRE